MSSVTPIQQATAAYFGVKLVELVEGRTMQPLAVVARHTAMYLERESGRTFSEIGRLYNRDHSAVITACRQMKERVELSDEQYTGAVSAIANVVKVEAQKKAESSKALEELRCPTCGAPVIEELRRQVAALQARVNELGGIK